MRPKVLLVDDSNTTRGFERDLLKQHMVCDVLTARDGSEGLRKALSKKPNLILLDVVMPTMDGFATREAMRRHDSLRTVPIVVLLTRKNPATFIRDTAAAATPNERFEKVPSGQ